MLIAINLIDNPKYLMRHVNRRTVEYLELVDSVKAHGGVLNAILVRPKGDRYELVDGFHRLNAARDAQLTEIDCIVQDLSDKEVLAAQLETGAVGVKTRPIEFAKRIKFILSQNPELSINQLSQVIHKSPTWIRNVLAVIDMDEEVHTAISDGSICLSNAIALAKLPADLQTEYADDAKRMKSSEFGPMVNQLVRDIRTSIAKENTNALFGDRFTPRSYLRNIAECSTELAFPQARDAVFDRMQVTTPNDAWVAALSWVMHLDPASIEQQKETRKRRFLNITREKDE